ncbi:MAG: hypothetical protein M1828_003583 [Chrysothrix sp. TS-e1954]|nr:MAG: hypothetical protein M1828_003583 [Chrysothrix sp. TS-e1954]
MSSCFSCLTASFKIYHFDNFTFAADHHTQADTTYARTHSLGTLFSHHSSYSFRDLFASPFRHHDHTSNTKPPVPRPSFTSQAFEQAHEQPYDPRSHDVEMSYQPPRGPPPSTYAPPSGPPPSFKQSGQQGQRLPSPDKRVQFARGASRNSVQGNSYSSNAAPPSYSDGQEAYAPPQGPPPSKSKPAYPTYPVDAEAPPEYTTGHDWASAVPDTSLLPPPPSISYHESTNNASEDDAARGHDFCHFNPLWPPRRLSDHELRGLTIGFSSLIRPGEMAGTVERGSKPGLFRVKTHRKCRDCCCLSSQPLYSALEGQRLQEAPLLAYFEVRVIKMDRDAGVAIGFAAPPYPTWRLPGWERASLGVHGDDGRRFVNDSYGGTDFTEPFKPGQILGIGLEFPPEQSNVQPPAYGDEKGKRPRASAKRRNVQVFFTRNGVRCGGWDLHEEVDGSRDMPGGVVGLEGDRDLHAAVGVFGGAEVEVIFGRHHWVWKP